MTLCKLAAIAALWGCHAQAPQHHHHAAAAHRAPAAAHTPNAPARRARPHARHARAHEPGIEITTEPLTPETLARACAEAEAEGAELGEACAPEGPETEWQENPVTGEAFTELEAEIAADGS